MDQQYQSLQLTDAEERLIKRLRLKNKVEVIIKSNKDIDVKQCLAKNLIEEARLKEKDYLKQWHIKNRDERLVKMRERNQEHRDEKLARYYEHQQRAIEMLGGTCIATGTTENLNFAHRDPSGKVFGPAEYLHCSNFFNNQKNVDELLKCSLLCNAAHQAYDKTFTSLGYPQNEETFPIWLETYKTWHSLHKDSMTYRKYLIKNPIMEITK